MSGAEERLESLFRKAFRRQASTVTVISYFDPQGRPCGLTATAVCSVSVAPPTLLACINRATKARDQIVERGTLGLNILASSQQDISNVCSKPGGEKVLPTTWLAAEPADRATPILRAALAHLDCEVARVHEEATHSIVVAHPCKIWLGAARDPLVYFDGAYCALAEEAEASFDLLWERFSTAFF